MKVGGERKKKGRKKNRNSSLKRSFQSGRWKLFEIARPDLEFRSDLDSWIPPREPQRSRPLTPFPFSLSILFGNSIRLLCCVMYTFTRMEMRREREASKRFGARIKDRGSFYRLLTRTSWLPTFSPISPRLDSKSMTEELNPQVSTVAPWSYSRSPVDLFFNLSYPRTLFAGWWSIWNSVAMGIS